MKKVNDFTLIELLLVIAIMVIVMSFSAPAFSKLNRGSSVGVSTGVLATQLGVARTTAITRRCYVAVIMPGSQFSVPSTDKNEYSFQSSRMAFVTKDSDGGFEFDQWIIGTEWRFMPRGAVIAEVDSDMEKQKPNTDEGVECTIVTKSTEDNETYGEITKREINGSWLGADKKLGLDSNATLVKDPDSKMTGKAQPVQGVRAVVFSPLGRVEGETKYVTIVEGVPKASGTDFVLINHNIHNMRILQVGKYTGKVVEISPVL